MKKLILILTMMVLLSLNVFGISVTRTLPDSVEPNSNINIVLTTSDFSGSYFGMVYENIPNGWIYVSGGELVGSTQIKFISTSLVSDTLTYTLKSSSSGTYTFSGTYQYANLNNFPVAISGDNSIIVSESCTPINGGWSDWGVWSECVNSIQSRTRTCTNPSPSCGGSNCVGDSSESKSCSIYSTGIVSRNLPSSANTNQVIDVILTAENYEGSYFAIVREDIPSGWNYVSGGSFEDGQVILFLTSAASNSVSYKLQSPSSSGTKLFIGTYQYTDADENAIMDMTTIEGNTQITINECVPDWSCTSYPTTCPSSCSQTRTCTDLNECGSDEGKPAESQSCSGGDCVGACIPDCSNKECGSDGCDSTCGTCESNEVCVSGVCIVSSTEQSCEDLLGCEMWEECNDEEDDCELAGWVYMIGIFFGLMFAFSMLK